VFGKNLGSNQEGKTRSEALRYAIDVANDWPWDPKRPNGPLERDHLCVLKAIVGLNESKTMKSALEMASRKIQKVEAVRREKIPEAQVNVIANLIRKGIIEAEKRGTLDTRLRRMIVEGILESQGYWSP
jgi:hypothetical protein